MKTANDPRHQKRVSALNELFAYEFKEQKVSSELALEIIKNLKNIDEIIKKSAPAWPISDLNKIDLAILRLSVYELESLNTPPKVVIDEAVELAKEFGAESSPSFINGVLGTIYKQEQV